MLLDGPGFAGQQGSRQARVVGNAEHPVQHGATQVRINDNDLLIGLRENDCEVRRCRALAFAGAGAGDKQGAHRLVHAGELDVRAQRAVGLRLRRLGAQPGDKLPRAAGLPQPSDRTQRRQPRDPFDVVRGLDRVIQILDEESRTNGQHGADHCREEGIGQRARANGIFRHDGRLGNHQVVGRLRLGDPGLLRACQERGVGGAILREAGLQPCLLGLVRGLQILLRARDIGQGRFYLGLQALAPLAHLPELLLPVAVDKDLRQHVGDIRDQFRVRPFDFDLQKQCVAHGRHADSVCQPFELDAQPGRGFFEYGPAGQQSGIGARQPLACQDIRISHGGGRIGGLVHAQGGGRLVDRRHVLADKVGDASSQQRAQND